VNLMVTSAEAVRLESVLLGTAQYGHLKIDPATGQPLGAPPAVPPLSTGPTAPNAASAPAESSAAT
jgi:hypothetical protein